MLERIRSLAYSLTSEPASLPGLWERVNDDFQGCLILVEENTDQLQGRITYVPALMRRYGWMVGDIKWRNINCVGAAAFTTEDLFKELDPDTNEVSRTTYQSARLYFLNSDEFALVTSGRGGRNSRWRRSGKAASKPSTSDEG